MKKTVLFIIPLLFLLSPSEINAQEYKSAISLRSGVSSGISIQFMRDDVNTIEGGLSFRNNGLQLTVLREYYRPVFLRRSSHIFAYYGFGGHLGFEWRNSNHYWDEYPHKVFSSGPAAGIDGIAGAEYRFSKVPIALGINYKPFAEFSITRFFNLNLWDFGFTCKYSFK
jgi:hypothetical protein